MTIPKTMQVLQIASYEKDLPKALEQLRNSDASSSVLKIRSRIASAKMNGLSANVKTMLAGIACMDATQIRIRYDHS